jgi:agmatine deiminase
MMNMIRSIASGYRMPAEWETHSATQLHWPSNRDTWPGDRLHRVETVYLDIIQTLHRYEPVILLADPSVKQKKIVEKFKARDINLSRVQIYSVPLNDVWARDCGPVFIKNKEGDVAITDWDYNAWGGKYPPFDSDNALPEWFAYTFNLTLFKPGMVLEGGSIDTNGEGVFLTTESVLLNKNRNPELSKKKIEKRLHDYLGAKKVIWLRKGLAGDDTDGHIDDVSRFLNQDTILTMVSDDPSDVNYHTLQENFEILQKARNLDGKPFRIITLPMPGTKIEDTTVDGSEYVPASYANFYIANGVVLVPLYDERFDDQALNLFAEYFPDRDIAGISCADLVWGQGSIHCITQQLYT